MRISSGLSSVLRPASPSGGQRPLRSLIRRRNDAARKGHIVRSDFARSSPAGTFALSLRRLTAAALDEDSEGLSQVPRMSERLKLPAGGGRQIAGSGFSLPQ